MKTMLPACLLILALLQALFIEPESRASSVLRGTRTAATEERKVAKAAVKSPQQEAADKAAAFMAAIAAKPGVVRTASGLCYEVIEPGTGDAPKPTDIVKAHYQGSLINGTVFESSRTRGEPVEFPLDKVISGWTEGLQKIAKGGKIKLYVPPHLGYGEQRRRGIPPGSALIFEVEIFDIKPAP